MDERNWLWFSVTTFFAFVVISYVRESKLVFLVEKYSTQDRDYWFMKNSLEVRKKILNSVFSYLSSISKKLEGLQNYTGDGGEATDRVMALKRATKQPSVKIYKIPSHLPEEKMVDFPDLQEMIESHYSEYEGNSWFVRLVLMIFLEGTDYGDKEVTMKLIETNVKVLDRTYEPEYEDILETQVSNFLSQNLKKSNFPAHSAAHWSCVVFFWWSDWDSFS